MDNGMLKNILTTPIMLYWHPLFGCVEQDYSFQSFTVGCKLQYQLHNTNQSPLMIPREEIKDCEGENNYPFFPPPLSLMSIKVIPLQLGVCGVKPAVTISCPHTPEH